MAEKILRRDMGGGFIQELTLIGVVKGIAFYEDPDYGDEETLLQYDAETDTLWTTDFWELPHPYELD